MRSDERSLATARTVNRNPLREGSLADSARGRGLARFPRLRMHIP